MVLHFGGNPIAIAAANATMDTIFDISFLNDLNEKADFFKKILEENLLEIPSVKEIRGGCFWTRKPWYYIWWEPNRDCSFYCDNGYHF